MPLGQPPNRIYDSTWLHGVLDRRPSSLWISRLPHRHVKFVPASSKQPTLALSMGPADTLSRIASCNSIGSLWRGVVGALVCVAWRRSSIASSDGGFVPSNRRLGSVYFSNSLFIRYRISSRTESMRYVEVCSFEPGLDMICFPKSFRTSVTACGACWHMTMDVPPTLTMCPLAKSHSGRLSIQTRKPPLPWRESVASCTVKSRVTILTIALASLRNVELL